MTPFLPRVCPSTYRSILATVMVSELDELPLSCTQVALSLIYSALSCCGYNYLGYTPHHTLAFGLVI